MWARVCSIARCSVDRCVQRNRAREQSAESRVQGEADLPVPREELEGPTAESLTRATRDRIRKECAMRCMFRSS